jgi:hypothetical protein
MQQIYVEFPQQYTLHEIINNQGTSSVVHSSTLAVIRWYILMPFLSWTSQETPRFRSLVQTRFSLYSTSLYDNPLFAHVFVRLSVNTTKIIFHSINITQIIIRTSCSKIWIHIGCSINLSLITLYCLMMVLWGPKHVAAWNKFSLKNIDWLKTIFVVLTHNLTKTHACDTQQDAPCENYPFFTCLVMCN